MENAESTYATVTLHNTAVDRNKSLVPGADPGRPQLNHKNYSGELSGIRVRGALINQRKYIVRDRERKKNVIYLKQVFQYLTL